MSHAFGAETVGLFQICLSVLFLLLALTAGGIPTVLSRKIAECEVNRDFKKQNRYVAASLILGSVLSAIVIAACYLGKNLLYKIFSDDRCVPLFLIMLPAIFTSTFYGVIRAWFWGKKKFTAFSFTELLDEVFKIAFTACFAGGLIAEIAGAKGIAIAFTVADAACVLILIVLFFINKGKFAKPEGFLELTKASTPLAALRIITGLMASLTAIIVPAQLALSMSQEEATAMYGRIAGMALPLLMAPSTIIGSLAVVLIPEMAGANAKGDSDTLRSKMDGSIIFAFFVSSLFMVLFVPLGKEIGKLFFGDETAGQYVSYCALLMYPIGLNQVTSPIVNSIGKEHKTLLHYLAGLVLLIPCILFLPRYIGAYAIAVGNGLCFLICAILNIVVLKKHLKGKNRFALKSFLSVLFAVPSLLLTYFIKGILSHYLSTVFVIIFAGGAGAVSYLLITDVFNLISFRAFFAKSKKKKKRLKGALV